MTRLINSATTVDDFEEIPSDNICEMDEDGNRTALQSSLVYNCLWTANFCLRPVQECQTSRKCSSVILSSPIQTFKRLLYEVFNLIIFEQSNMGDMIRWVDITKSQLEKFIGINIIMGYCKNLSMDCYWSTDGFFSK
jgi:hypothetical protein